MKGPKSNSRIVGMLVFTMVQVYWGVTTILMQNALHYMSSFAYTMLRFVPAGIVLLLLFGKRLYRNFSKDLLLHGALLGVYQVIPMECMVVALNYTTASSVAFLTQLTFVIVPVLRCITLRRKPSFLLVGTIVSLIVGFTLFSNVSGLWNVGNLICIAAAGFNAMGILSVGKYTRSDDPMLLASIQVAVCGVCSIPIWLFSPGGVDWCVESVTILFLTGIIGSALACVLSLYGQSKLEPITVSFGTLLQPIFSMIGSAIIPNVLGQTEPIRWYMVAGTVIMIAALTNYIKCTSGEPI